LNATFWLSDSNRVLTGLAQLTSERCPTQSCLCGCATGRLAALENRWSFSKREHGEHFFAEHLSKKDASI
jgi:hypothetical protein